MPLDKLSAQQISVDRFWDNYLFILNKNAVSKRSIPWYRKHAEAYKKAKKAQLLIIKHLMILIDI